MKKILTVFLLIMIALMFSACADSAEKLGLVNGKQLPRWQFDYYISSGVSSYASYGIEMTDELKAALMPQIEQNAWDSAVANQITIQEAKAKDVSVTDDEVQKVLDEQVKVNFDTDEAYQTWLGNIGLTEDQVRELLTVSQLNAKLYDLLSADVSITEDDARASYEADPSQWDERKVSHILITATADGTTAGDPASDEEALALAKDLISRLNQGEDFAALAKKYSDDTTTGVNGGVLDQYFTAVDTSLMAEFVAGGFALQKVGDFSQEPVQTSYGYHIIKLDEEKTGFDTLKADIIKSLTESAKSEKFNTYMNGQMEAAKLQRLTTFEYWADGNSTITLHRNFFQKVYDRIKSWFGHSVKDDLTSTDTTTSTDTATVTDDGTATVTDDSTATVTDDSTATVTDDSTATVTDDDTKTDDD